VATAAPEMTTTAPAVATTAPAVSAVSQRRGWSDCDCERRHERQSFKAGHDRESSA